MNPRPGLMLLVLFLLVSGQAWTHQQKEAITRVLFNPRTGNIEVMHRFLIHDAEHAVRQLRNGEANILGSQDDREFFSGYVHRRFTITDQEHQLLELKAVGHEIEGRFLWVYAETPTPKGIESLVMRHDALRDIWPEQVNLVNVERHGNVKSATFMGGTKTLTIELASP